MRKKREACFARAERARRGISSIAMLVGTMLVPLQAASAQAKAAPAQNEAAVTETSPQYYFDMSSQYKITSFAEIVAGVDNMFNNKPPIMGTVLAGDANTDPSLYDVIGSRYFLGLRVKF